MGWERHTGDLCHELVGVRVCVCAHPSQNLPCHPGGLCVAWLCPKLVCAQEWHSCNLVKFSTFIHSTKFPSRSIRPADTVG